MKIIDKNGYVRISEAPVMNHPTKWGVNSRLYAYTHVQVQTNEILGDMFLPSDLRIVFLSWGMFSTVLYSYVYRRKLCVHVDVYKIIYQGKPIRQCNLFCFYSFEFNTYGVFSKICTYIHVYAFFKCYTNCGTAGFL